MSARSGRLSRLVSAAAFGACVLFAGAAWADGRAELEKARAAYIARNYAEAEDRLRALVDPKTGLKESGLLAQARINLGAVLLAEGKRDQAKEVFEKLVLEDPAFEPDPLSFPGDVINTFIDVRAQLRERIKAAAENAARLEAEKRKREAAEKEAREAWLAKVEAMARQEKITARRSRLVACLPFGAGQFQNGQPVLGWIFFGTELAAAAGIGLTIPMYAYARTREQEELNRFDPELKAAGYHQRSVDLVRVSLGLAGAFAVIAGAGIIQANAAYTPEKVEVKTRDLPPLDISRLAPTVSAVPGADGGLGSGLVLGVSGVVF
jgi:tetratricopeptide (TPR) repeat protein